MSDSSLITESVELETGFDGSHKVHCSLPSQLRLSMENNGYVIIPGILSAEELQSLRAASHTMTELARSCQWPHVRTLPKQFPPWPSDPSSGIWGVQHLMHPTIPSSLQDVFLHSYFNESIIAIVKALLSGDGEAEVSDGDLVMELYNLLVRPEQNFELRWHRDDLRPEATPEEEMKILDKKQWHTQWNLALYKDSSLVVVPGSHRRPRTMSEKSASPFEKHLEGMQIVELKAGDAVFYNNNILHRGVYDSCQERATLHGSVGHVKGGNHRARNVLQHGIRDWMKVVDFSGLAGSERGRAEIMRQRLLELGSTVREVGFSQVD